jgi:hypothetical protein
VLSGTVSSRSNLHQFFPAINVVCKQDKRWSESKQTL